MLFVAPKVPFPLWGIIREHILPLRLHSVLRALLVGVMPLHTRILPVSSFLSFMVSHRKTNFCHPRGYYCCPVCVYWPEKLIRKRLPDEFFYTVIIVLYYNMSWYYSVTWSWTYFQLLYEFEKFLNLHLLSSLDVTILESDFDILYFYFVEHIALILFSRLFHIIN